MNNLSAILAAMIMTGFVVPASANNADSGLYDPLPPEDSAFVRYINVSQESGSKEAKASGKIFDYLDFRETSPYFVVPEGDVEAAIGDVKKNFNAKSGAFYTVALKGGALEVFQDEQSDNRAKAQLIMYNFGPGSDLSLKTGNGQLEIIPAVATSKSGMREINPVRVPLAVYDGQTILSDLGSLSLDRAQSYSVVVFPDKKAEFVKGSTNTTR